MIDVYYFNATILNNAVIYRINEHKVPQELFFKLKTKLVKNNYCKASSYQSSMTTKNYYRNTITQVWRAKEDEA